DEATGDQNLTGLCSFAVAIEDVLRLAADVERLGRLALHAVSELKAVDAGVECGIEAPLLLVATVEGRQSIELPPLYVGRQPGVFHVLDQLVDLGVLGIDVSALINAWQESRLPVLRLLNRIAAGNHRNEARQIEIFRPETVRQPRAKARPNEARFAAIHQEQRRLMIGHLRVHGSN